jgi:hypothetical protein
MTLGVRRNSGLLVCVALAAGHCKGAGSEPGYQPQPSAAPRPRIAALDQTGELPAALHADTVWQRAAAGDPMDLSTLGRAQGAASLLGWVSSGQRAGWIALQAFAFAEDAASHQGELCDLMPRLRVEDRVAVLGILQQVTTRSALATAEDRERCSRVLATDLGPALTGARA